MFSRRFVFFYLKSGTFLDLLNKWRQIESLSYCYIDKASFLKINGLAFLVMASAISENAVSHVKSFLKYGDNTNKTILQWYYEDSHEDWAEVIPYNAWITATVFVCNKWAVYAWNFGDVFVTILSIALYGQFKVFLQVARNVLMKNMYSGTTYYVINGP